MINLLNKFFVVIRSLYVQVPFKKKSIFNGFRIGKGSLINNPSSIAIGDKVNIGKGAILNCSKNKPQALSIGNNVYIGRDLQLNAYESVVIGDSVLISDRVYISDATHNQFNYEEPIKDQGTRFKGKVCIKSGSWIGIGVAIMPGVIIGKNSIVSANSVVIHDVPDFQTVAGAPAKIIIDGNASGS